MPGVSTLNCGPRWPPLSRNTSASSILKPKFGRERVGEGLAGPQRRTVLGRQDADLALRDAHFGLGGVHVVEDVDQQPGMEAGGEDFGLRAVLAVHGDDPPFSQRTAAVDAKELSQIPIGHANEGGRRDREQDRQDADDTQCTVHESISKLLRQQGGPEEGDNGPQHHTQRESEHV